MGLLVAMSMTARVIACSARGATSALIQKQTSESAIALRKTGKQMRGTLTPFAFSAINSLSADILPKNSRIAVRKPQGIVKVRENGSTSAMKATTVNSGTSGLLMRISRSCWKIFPNTKTRLKTMTPMNAVRRTPEAT